MSLMAVSPTPPSSAHRELRDRHLPAVRANSTVDVAAESLRVAIVDGTIRPGDRLVEATISEQMQISRNTVREVFRTLEAERLLLRAPNRGVVVRTLSDADIADIYVVRTLAEAGAVRMAAKAPASAIAHCIRQMREALDDAEYALEVGDVHLLAMADIHLHTAITHLAGSERLVDLVTGIKAELRLAFGSVPDRLAFHAAYVPRNRELFELISARRFDEAATAIENYLEASQAQLLELMSARRDASHG